MTESGADIQIKVFSKDIRTATDLAGTSAQTGVYDLHDMVMLE